MNFEEYSKKELASLLLEYYPSIRNKNGEKYAIQTLVNARSGINRYLNLPPFNSDWNLMIDSEFHHANKIFKGLRRKLKEEGRDKTKRKPILTPSDLNKIYTDYFEPNFENDPTCLQHKVYFDIAYFLGRRGSEGLRDLTKDSFELKKTEDGKEYLQLTYHERTKKCQGEEYDPYREENIIIAQPNSLRCPVNSFKLYLSKLSTNLNAFFQRPNKKFKKEGQPWYIASVVGINAIGKFLQEISKRSKLNTIYTNHCIRGTTATALKKLGFSIPEIASVTKHRNYQSLEHYLEKPTLEERGKFSESLFNYAANQNMCTNDGDIILSQESEMVPDNPPLQEVNEDRLVVAVSHKTDNVNGIVKKSYSKSNNEDNSLMKMKNHNNKQKEDECVYQSDDSGIAVNHLDEQVDEMGTSDTNISNLMKTQNCNFSNDNLSTPTSSSDLSISNGMSSGPGSDNSNVSSPVNFAATNNVGNLPLCQNFLQETQIPIPHHQAHIASPPVNDMGMIQKRAAEVPPSGLFLGAHLSNCSIHIRVSN